ncbi:hypothetical protein BKA70DRAFT_1230689 [Coprinopsis sp. MPI-PUGE-AT-0042]|nr:hypothetical protein BKA70DRAFT_1230689 [Coprinopsis sp. MPI-PUGE-AT-0042]
MFRDRDLIASWSPFRVKFSQSGRNCADTTESTLRKTAPSIPLIVDIPQALHVQALPANNASRLTGSLKSAYPRVGPSRESKSLRAFKFHYKKKTTNSAGITYLRLRCDVVTDDRALHQENKYIRLVECEMKDITPALLLFTAQHTITLILVSKSVATASYLSKPSASSTMKFTIVAIALALTSGVAAQGYDRQEAMRNLARSLIAEYEDFLGERVGDCKARPTKDSTGLNCDPISCDKYCVKGEKKCGWTEQPKGCKKCSCTKA